MTSNYVIRIFCYFSIRDFSFEMNYCIYNEENFTTQLE